MSEENPDDGPPEILKGPALERELRRMHMSLKPQVAVQEVQNKSQHRNKNSGSQAAPNNMTERKNMTQPVTDDSAASKRNATPADVMNETIAAQLAYMRKQDSWQASARRSGEVAVGVVAATAIVAGATWAYHKAFGGPAKTE